MENNHELSRRMLINVLETRSIFFLCSFHHHSTGSQCWLSCVKLVLSNPVCLVFWLEKKAKLAISFFVSICNLAGWLNHDNTQNSTNRLGNNDKLIILFRKFYVVLSYWIFECRFNRNCLQVEFCHSFDVKCYIFRRMQISRLIYW